MPIGYKHSEQTKLLMRQSALARNNTKRLQSLPKGEQHWRWKQDPSISNLHRRIVRKYGKASDYKCIDCHKTACDWSNQTGNYTDKIKDYVPRCRKCHINYDGNRFNGVHVWKKLGRDSSGKFISI